VSTIVISPELELRYGCDRAHLPVELAERFVQLDYDDAARAFVAEAFDAPHGPFRTWVYANLRKLMSDYDAYGLLGMYPMHVLSTSQLDRLLGSCARGELLDVGAGDGGVTAHAAKLFERVSATDASAMLKRRLRKRGYEVLEHDFTQAPLAGERRFDAALCLNVIDRCTHPRSLLRNVAQALAPGAPLIVTVPLPLKPHVHVGRYTVDQEERLPEPKSMWELGATNIAHKLLTPLGLEVRALSRVPYLCRGDSTTPLYSLDDAVFVCTRASA
jgi:SAM-dependent methyltransferase